MLSANQVSIGHVLAENPWVSLPDPSLYLPAPSLFLHLDA